MFRRVTRAGFAPLVAVAARALNIHEYQAKAILKEAHANVEFGLPASTIPEAETVISKIKTPQIVVKAQILAGGRGRGTFIDNYKGGVHVCDSPAAALEAAKHMLGNTLVTKQTGPQGQLVSKVYISDCLTNIARQVYVALVLDRKTCAPTFIGCAEGGMGIEEVAQSNPAAIKRMSVNIQDGIERDKCIAFAEELGFKGSKTQELAADQFVAMYTVGKTRDCTMVEINPMVELTDGTVMCVDAKLSFDDNAQFRQPEVWALRDTTQMDPKEVKAEAAGLNYIALDGNVGCLVNGAGLAMATMDIISLYGQSPANFLDVGGSATTDQIVKAFEIVTMDPNVKCILVNIFGGIMKCDIIAVGVVEATKLLQSSKAVPIVARLEGTNDAEGKDIIDASGLTIHYAKDLNDAGRIATSLVAKTK